ncbi:hypothetical protein V501_01601, partial [Pseudogymnoascus sp. VKM F-4519 (FW-2642)]
QTSGGAVRRSRPADKTAVITIVNRDEPSNSRRHSKLLAALLEEVAQHNEVLVTLIIGNGRTFSAYGMPLSCSRASAKRWNSCASMINPSPAIRGSDASRYHPNSLLLNEFSLSEVFHSHPKLLVTALNGPVVGLFTAAVAHADLIYATLGTYLLNPFLTPDLTTYDKSSINLINCIKSFVAKYTSQSSPRISAKKLNHVGFVNKLFDAGDDHNRFKQMVLNEIRHQLDAQIIHEAFGGESKFGLQKPAAESARIERGPKIHKL